MKKTIILSILLSIGARFAKAYIANFLYTEWWFDAAREVLNVIIWIFAIFAIVAIIISISGDDDDEKRN